MHLRIRAPLTQQALVSLRIATRYLACRGRCGKRVIGDVDTARSPCCRQCCAAQQFTTFHIHVSCPPEKIQLAGLSAYTKWPPALQVGSTHLAFGPAPLLKARGGTDVEAPADDIIGCKIGRASCRERACL